MTVGALLRLNYGGGCASSASWPMRSESRLPQKAGSVWTVTFDRAAGALPRTIEIVEAALAIDDGAGRSERHERLGTLTAAPALDGYYPGDVSPRWCIRTISWVDSALTPDDLSLASDPAAVGDRSPAARTGIRTSRPRTSSTRSGLSATTSRATASTRCRSSPTCRCWLPRTSTRRFRWWSRASCSARSRWPAPPSRAAWICPQRPVAPEPPLADLVNLRLDPAIPEDLERITTLQTRAVDFAGPDPLLRGSARRAARSHAAAHPELARALSVFLCGGLPSVAGCRPAGRLA